MISILKLEPLPDENLHQCARRVADEFFVANYNQSVARMPSGRPTIDGYQISISHTGRFLAVMVGKSRCGVDIEFTDRDVTRVVHKFASAQELQIVRGLPFGALLIWCAKEAMYKLLDKRGVDFLQDLFIDSINANHIKASACGVNVELEWRISSDNLLIINTL